MKPLPGNTLVLSGGPIVAHAALIAERSVSLLRVELASAEQRWTVTHCTALFPVVASGQHSPSIREIFHLMLLLRPVIVFESKFPPGRPSSYPKPSASLHAAVDVGYKCSSCHFRWVISMVNVGTHR